MSLILDPAPTPRTHASPADIARLREALDRLRRQARRWVWIESLALIGLWAAAFFWATLLLDWWCEPPREVRAALVAIGVAGLAWLVTTKIVSRLTAPLDDVALALAVERTHPEFRDSLSTAIEAAHGDIPADPALLARTAAAAAALVGGIQPNRIFQRRSLMQLVAAAGMAAATVAATAAWQPDVAARWMQRIPQLRNESWPRRVRLVAEGFVDGRRMVARGTDVELLVQAVAGHEIPGIVDLRWRPAAARGRSWRWERMGTRGGTTEAGQQFGHVLKAVSESIDLEIRGGDARLRPLRLEVVDAPALESLAITTTLPAYLGGGTRQAAPARIVRVPRGSNVEIKAMATKPLTAAEMATVAGGNESTVATRADDRSILGRIADVAGEQTIIVRFTDTHGLTNREPMTFVLAAVPDEPPQVAITLRGISSAVTPRARLPVQGTISDDHGLADAAVRLRVGGGGGAPAGNNAVVERLQPITAVTAGAAVVELRDGATAIVPLEPLSLALGTRLEVAVVATDGCNLDGGPNRATSESWSLDVVAPENLLALLEAREVLLRRRYEAAIVDLAQARDRLAAILQAAEAADAGRLAEAVARATGETGEIAAAFRDIRLELDNNQLLSPELDTRLEKQIALPLDALATRDLPGLMAACRKAVDAARGRQVTNADSLVRQADDVLVRMRAVLDMMMELESFNEVVERLRGVIRTQEEIRSETLDQQKKRAREALEGP